MEKHVVVISKSWAEDTPILIDVQDTQIAVSMPLEAFMARLAEEAGNPAMLLTAAQLRARLERAAGAVCEKMKRETTKVM